MAKKSEIDVEKIKSWALRAMFADDELLEQLVLKGGNAMALVHRVAARASVDLDFSMAGDMPGGAQELSSRAEKALLEVFKENNLQVFDFKLTERPPDITEDMKEFSGGYGIEFKLIPTDVYEVHQAKVEELRKRAINLGQGTKFLIDISRAEITDEKQTFDFEGYRIYVYSPEMIVCEKLRAICQQMPEYGAVVRRNRAGASRARDFVDIEVLVRKFGIDVSNGQVKNLLIRMFAAKKVPLKFLRSIRNYKEFHAQSFPVVKDTIIPGVKLEAFDYYFEFVCDLVERLEPLRDE